jgi:twitching motility protein PilI
VKNLEPCDVTGAVGHGSLVPLQLSPTDALLRGFELGGEATPDDSSAFAVAGPAMPSSSSEGAVLLREGFRIGAVNLMIGYADGSELTDLPAIHALPGTPGWFSGMSNLHGKLVPVFDLARYAGVDSIAGAKPMLLVLGHGADAAGVVIDGLPQRLRLNAAERMDAVGVPAALQDCIDGAFLIEDQQWLNLRAGALLDRLENELREGVALG